MDGAGWHKDFKYLLQDTKKIKIILQPPYSPELNPVEKLWQYIMGLSEIQLKII